MKALRNIAYFLIMFIPLLQSCDKDDKELKINDSNLIGVWQLILDEGYETLYDGERESWKYDCEDNEYYWVLEDDGNGYVMRGNRIQESFEWKIKNLKLYVEDRWGEEIYTIASLTSTTLALEQKGTDDDGSFYYKETYRRVDISED